MSTNTKTTNSIIKCVLYDGCKCPSCKCDKYLEIFFENPFTGSIIIDYETKKIKYTETSTKSLFIEIEKKFRPDMLYISSNIQQIQQYDIEKILCYKYN